MRENSARLEVMERKRVRMQQRKRNSVQWKIEKKALSNIKSFVGESYQDFLNRVSYERDQREKEWKQKIEQERDFY